MTPLRITTCGTCGANIFWAQTENGKPMPIDAEPVANGNIIIRPALIAHYLAKAEQPPADVLRYVSHFATCPHAKQHRKVSNARTSQEAGGPDKAA